MTVHRRDPSSSQPRCQSNMRIHDSDKVPCEPGARAAALPMRARFLFFVFITFTFTQFFSFVVIRRKTKR